MKISKIEARPEVHGKKCLGLDRLGRKCWWLCDMLIVEDLDKGKVHYYTTKDELISLANVIGKFILEKILEIKDSCLKQSNDPKNSNYINLFKVNFEFLSRDQHQEERNKVKQLANRFTISLLDIKRLDSIIFNFNLKPLFALRRSLINLENSIHSAFMHSNWSLHRKNWLAKVSRCRSAKNLSLALSVLASSIKTIAFNPVWNNSLGHYLLDYTTADDREERKKIEKRERRERIEEFDMLMRSNSVKFSLLNEKMKRMQLFGEEYRITGSLGWLWRSSTRVHHKCTSEIKIVKIDELTQEEANKVKNTDTINVMRELRLEDQDKRIYYPKKFKKEAYSKLELIESLLFKRIRLEEALEAEKAITKSWSDLQLTCYSSDCRSLKLQNKSTDLKCYSYDCRNTSSKDKNELDGVLRKKENEEETNKKETSEIFDCAKPIYLFKVNKRNEIQRKLNTKLLLGISQLPPCSLFKTKSGKKSIFVLPNYELRKLARCSGLREVCGFNYAAKYNPYIWPFHSTPRPSFKTCWLFRIIKNTVSLDSVALAIKVLWHCLNLNEMIFLAKVDATSDCTVIQDGDETIKTELIKRRDLAPFGLQSEYLQRKIIESNDAKIKKDVDFKVRNTTPNSKREGLRERKKVNYFELSKQNSIISENWVPEEELKLIEIIM